MAVRLPSVVGLAVFALLSGMFASACQALPNESPASAACNTATGVECQRCCAKAQPISMAELQHRLECTCIASSFCKADCESQPVCTMPPTEVSTACKECLLANTFTNCGSSTSSCRSDASCMQSYRVPRELLRILDRTNF